MQQLFSSNNCTTGWSLPVLVTTAKTAEIFGGIKISKELVKRLR